jgi:integral membrane protein
MVGMTTSVPSRFGIGTVAERFRLVALAEAASWAGLLAGMYFKYLGTPRTEIGVKVFGMAHGLIFIAFAVVAIHAAFAFRWTAKACLLALLASVVPLTSVTFLIWADRSGRLTRDARCRPPTASQPDRPPHDVTNLSA